jgi:hypothetical protein
LSGNFRGFSSENDYEKPVRQSNPSTCKDELLYRDSDSIGMDMTKISWADLV